MTTYRTTIKIDDPNNVVISGVPFSPGESVEVTFTTKSEQSLKHTQALKELFRQTQSLSQAEVITEEEISAEITAYRAHQ